MKVSSEALFEVVRQVVQEELKRLLPEMVKNHLTETYMRKLFIENQVRPAPKPVNGKLAEVLMTPKDEEEDQSIPAPMENSDEGIYADTNIGKNESRSKLLSPDNPFAFIYEGVKPIGEEDVGPPSIPIQKAGIDFSRIAAISEGVAKRSAGSGDQTTMSMKMRELEERRKMLDRKP